MADRLWRHGDNCGEYGNLSFQESECHWKDEPAWKDQPDTVCGGGWVLIVSEVDRFAMALLIGSKETGMTLQELQDYFTEKNVPPLEVYG